MTKSNFCIVEIGSLKKLDRPLCNVLMKHPPLPGQVTLCLTWLCVAELFRLLLEAVHLSNQKTVLLIGKDAQLCQQVEQLWQNVTQLLPDVRLISHDQENDLNETIEPDVSLVLLSSHFNFWLRLELIVSEELTWVEQVGVAENSQWQATFTFDQSAISTFLNHPAIVTSLPADRILLAETTSSNLVETLQPFWLKLFPLLYSDILHRQRPQTVPVQQALSQTGQFFRLFLEESVDIFAEFDSELRYVFVNTLGCRSLNLPFAEILGRTNQELLGNTAIGLEQLIQQTFEMNQKVFANYIIHLLDSERVFETICLPIADVNGVVQRVVCACRDMTELKQQWQTIVTQNQEFATATQLKQEFIATTSHELRAPLTAILGFSNVLRQEFFGDLTTKQRDYLDRIHSSGLHLLELINDILDLSRIEAHHMELELQPVSIVDICENVLSLIQERAASQGLSIELELAHDLRYIVADPKRLKQMLLNLLTNAVKFTPVGTVGLKVYHDRSEPNAASDLGTPVQLARASEELVMIHFLVWDTGIGIDEADQSQLFRPFSQVGDSAFYKQQGTGLGLAITRKLAELHGGLVTLKSALGEGVQFTLSLPLRVIGE